VGVIQTIFLILHPVTSDRSAAGRQASGIFKGVFMPPYISPVFKYHGRRPNQFDEAELVDLLCPQPYGKEAPLRHKLGLGASVSLKNDQTGSRMDFKLEKSADGKTITLDSTLVRDNVTYKTALVARQVKDDLYQITKLTFDNHEEKLSHRWEITKVLAHIGKAQLQKAAQGIIPLPHEESGKFSKFRRFLTRCLPDDPTTMTPPPF
jgi:hypothetical protein